MARRAEDSARDDDRSRMDAHDEGVS